MEADKPDNQEGCQLSYEQLASRLDRLEKQHASMIEMYEKRISALEKDVASLKKQKQAITDILVKSIDLPTKESTEKSIPIQLPPKLSSEKAMLLWKKLITAGLIDKNFQPLLSNPQAAYVAHIMARELNIRNKWKLFGELWNIRFLGEYLYRALNQQQNGDFMNYVEHLLTDL